MSLKTFTKGELFSFQEPLRELAKLDVPAKVGIRIARLIRAISQEIGPIEQVRNKLVMKYGKRDERGQVSVGKDSPEFDAFAKEFGSLMEEKTKVEFEKVVLPDEVHVALDVLVALEPFLAVADIPSVNPNGVAKAVVGATS